VSVVPGVLTTFWPLGFLPLVYVAAITMISRGEVHGKNKAALYAGLFMYVLVIIAIAYMPIVHHTNIWEVLPFLALLSYMV
ncbi:hypothetical protein ACWKSR_12800, partial [Campylobacter fetus subsp. venerealis]